MKWMHIIISILRIIINYIGVDKVIQFLGLDKLIASLWVVYHRIGLLLKRYIAFTIVAYMIIFIILFIMIGSR
jgi:hypothetical protein